MTAMCHGTHRPGLCRKDGCAGRTQFVVLCECGCGEPTLVAVNQPRQPQRFLLGHNVGRPLPACGVEGCDQLSTYRYKLVCAMHYHRIKVHGSTSLPERPEDHELLMLNRSIDPDSGCWNWTGTIADTGYGRVRKAYAHRVAYEFWIGPIPDGLQIDHLCRNRRCFNPEHLEAVTQRENILRGESPMARHARRTHCVHGHEFTAENTYSPPSGATHRHCRTCIRNRPSRVAPDA